MTNVERGPRTSDVELPPGVAIRFSSSRTGRADASAIPRLPGRGRTLTLPPVSPTRCGLLVLCGGLLAALSLPGPLAKGAEPAPYRLLREIPVGGEGGWDYLSVDEAGRRLYLTHASKVVVVDLDRETVVGEIADTPGVHGFALAPELGRGFASNGRENTVSVVDLGTLRTLLKVPTGQNPDAILYEPGRREVYAFNGQGHSATVFDAASGEVVATVPLSGKPEFAACDPAAGRVYVNIEDHHEVVAIDAGRHEVAATWPIAPGEEATGMDVDLAHHRLFLGCHNRLLVMMNSANGEVLATAPIGGGVDATFFDPGTGLIFSSNGEGSVTVLREDPPGKLAVVQTLATERGARTMALDPRTHRIYLASARFEPAPEPAPGAPRPRPTLVPGSFKVLVFGSDAAGEPAR